MEFIEANAEALPLPDGQFDVAVSEYGASIWCNPELWIPEAARVLRSSGEWLFMRNSTLSMLCMPDSGQVTETLQRPMKALERMEWMDDDPGVEFHPPTSELIRLLRGNGFEIVDMVEVFAPDGAKDHLHPNWTCRRMGIQVAGRRDLACPQDLGRWRERSLPESPIAGKRLPRRVAFLR